MPNPLPLPEQKPDQKPDQKTAEILASLRTTFAEKGFDGASMQDLARAAGISAGNFYRYFPSKAAIIQALISADMHHMGDDFETTLQSRDPMGDLRTKLRAKLLHHQCSNDGCLWAEIHAVAMRKPDVAAILHAMEAQITAYLMQVFATHTGLTRDQAEAAFAPQAGLIITLFRAAAMIGSPSGPVRTSVTDQLIATIDTTLDAISSHARKV